MKAWELFGYAQDAEAGELIRLSEVTMVGTPERLRALAAFLLRAADTMEKTSGVFDHTHWSHDGGEENGDVIVARQ
jgi:hypothetical protein